MGKAWKLHRKMCLKKTFKSVCLYCFLMASLPATSCNSFHVYIQKIQKGFLHIRNCHTASQRCCMFSEAFGKINGGKPSKKGDSQHLFFIPPHRARKKNTSTTCWERIKGKLEWQFHFQSFTKFGIINVDYGLSLSAVILRLCWVSCFLLSLSLDVKSPQGRFSNSSTT